jgi:hypothetical protein
MGTKAESTNAPSRFCGFFLLPEPCRAKQAKQGVLGWVEANPVISGGWITQNCWKNMFYYWKYWK